MIIVCLSSMMTFHSLCAQSTLPNAKHRAMIQRVPSDSLYSRQWYAQRIGMERAWDITTGSTSVTIAIIAEGFDMNHPDLRDAWFINTADPIDGIDNDRNGYVDDNRGWDFIGRSDAQSASVGVYAEDNDPTNPNLNVVNGTHLAGIIAARHNSGGIAGIAPGCRILPIKIANDDASVPFSARLADGIRYATQMGARIILVGVSRYNAQPGVLFDAAEQNVLNAAIGGANDRGAIVLVPAGDAPSGSILPLIGDNTSYPASYQNVLALGASGIDDRPLPNSLIGMKMSLYAPGEQILSTIPGGGYAVMSGTRQAAAVAAGVAGLILSQMPNMSVQALVAELRATSDNVLQSGVISASSERDQTYYGRIHALNALVQTIPNIALNTVNALGFADPITQAPQSGLVNTLTSLVTFRLRNYADQAQGAATNVRITVQPIPLGARVSEQTTPQTVSIAQVRAGEVVNASFRLRLTGEAFTTTAIASPIRTADVLVNIVADNYQETLIVPIPYTLSPTDIVNVVVPSSIDMGRGASGIQRDVVLGNGTNSRVTINSMSLTGAQAREFQIVSINGRTPSFPLQIDSGSIANVRLRFTTTANVSGVRTAQLHVRSINPILGDTTYTARVTVFAEPGLLSVTQASVLASTIIGSTTSYTLSVQNVGVQSLTNVRLSLITTATGTRGEFAGNDTLVAELRGGASIMWRGVFAPNQPGRRSAVVRMTADNVRASDYIVSSIGLQNNALLVVRNENGVVVPVADDAVMVIDSAQFGASTFLTNLSLLNTATTAQTVGVPRFAGVGAGDFSASFVGTSASSISIPAGGSVPISVQFTARLAGEKYSTMSVQSTTTTVVPPSIVIVSQGMVPRIFWTTSRPVEEIIASRYGEQLPILFPLFLSRGQNPVIANFAGLTPLGTTSRIGVAVRNSGAVPLTINGLSVAQSAFRVVSVFPKSLSAGQTDTLTVEYTPTAVQQIASVAVLTASQSSVTIRDTAMIVGIGSRGAMIVAGNANTTLRTNAVSIPTTRVNNTNTVSIPIANVGSRSGDIVVRVSGADSSEFSIIRPFGRYSVPAGIQDSLVVRFAPRIPGRKNATVLVDLPEGAGSMRFPLLAQAVASPTLTTNVNALNIGAVEEEDTVRRVIQIRGTDLMAPVQVLVAGHPAVYTPFDVNRFARGRTFFPNDEGAIIDSLVVMVNPIRQPDTIVATLTVQSADMVRNIVVSATSIPMTRPVLRLPLSITFDTVQTNITYLRGIGLFAANLTNDISVALPAGFQLRSASGDTILSSSGVLRRWSSRMDSSLVLAFTPRTPQENFVDTVRFSSVVSGTAATATILRVNVPITARIVPQPSIASSIPLVTFANITVRQSTVARISITGVGLATGSTVFVDLFNADPRFTLLDHRGQDIGQIAVFDIGRSATQFSTTITVRFTSDSVGVFVGRIQYSAVSVNGDTLSGFTSLRAQTIPTPSIQATTTGVEFGTVRLFSNTPRVIQVSGTALTDSIRVTMPVQSSTATPSPFSVQFNGERYLRSFNMFPDQFGRLTSSFVVWFEPTDTGRFVDTLFFASRDIRYMIVLGGTSGTVSSVPMIQNEEFMRIIPSVVTDDAVLEIRPSDQHRISLMTHIEIISAEGMVQKVIPLHIDSQRAQRIPIVLRDMPQGSYMWRAVAQTPANGAIAFMGKFVIVR